MILIKSWSAPRQIIWRDLTAKEEIFTKYSCERAGKSTLYFLQFWQEMSAYLVFPLWTKHIQWWEHKHDKKYALNQQIL